VVAKLPLQFSAAIIAFGRAGAPTLGYNVRNSSSLEPTL